jgi:hypothetical protein
MERRISVRNHTSIFQVVFWILTMRLERSNCKKQCSLAAQVRFANPEMLADLVNCAEQCGLARQKHITNPTLPLRPMNRPQQCATIFEAKPWDQGSSFGQVYMKILVA